MKSILILERKYRDLEKIVMQYGYDYNDEPKCKNSGCDSELNHLLSDWSENFLEMKKIQANLEMNHKEFEKLLGAMYVADKIFFE